MTLIGRMDRAGRMWHEREQHYHTVAERITCRCASAVRESTAMISDDEQNLFEDAREHVADAVSALVTDGPHHALTYAAILSEVSSRITKKDFWDDERPNCSDFQGYWNLTWRLQEKAFAELEITASAPSL